jgi:growth factor-regulated tyrosine kinase substrate
LYSHFNVNTFLLGFQFPVLKEVDAMFDVEEAPQWVHDSDAKNCYRCRTEFSAFNRRHHCRACGQIFCNTCSSKTAAIPKYGIEKEVRVCDTCFEKLNSNVPLPSESELPLEYLNSALYREAKASQEAAASKSVSKSNSGTGLSSSGGGATSTAAPKSNEKTEEEFQEELQLALALSQSEIEAKKVETAQKSKSKSSSKSNGHSKSSISASNNSNNALYANEPMGSANATAPFYEASPSPQQNTKQYKETSGKFELLFLRQILQTRYSIKLVVYQS